MDECADKLWGLKCVASTDKIEARAPTASSSLPPALQREKTRQTDSTYFKSAHWTADGTTIVSNSADNCLRTFVLPPDLLDGKAGAHFLTPYHATLSREPIYSVALYPFFSLQDTSTTILLSSIREHPIRLTSALYPGLISSYSLISPTTEAVITPHSILYPETLGGTKFLTGSDSLICVFDVSRPGKDGPISRLPTIPSKRRKMVGGGIGMKGIISTLADNPSGDGIVAAGTFTRQVGLYAGNGSGDTIAIFGVGATEAEHHIGGKGITQLLWSPCGRYLYVAERKSDGMLVYDIRVTGRLVGWLKGRKAMTNQRLYADMVPGHGSEMHEIWAGGTDGCVRMWKHAAQFEGETRPTWERKIHDDPITSTTFHPTGSVMVSCSGQKHYTQYGNEEEISDDVADWEYHSQQIDNSMRLWQL